MDGQRILVLNEDEATAVLVSDVLQGFDIDAVFATTRRDFIEAYEDGYECIVMALCLPDFDGFEAVKFLRDRQYAGTLILLSLAMAEMGEIVEKYAGIFGLRVAGSLRRPLDPDEFMSTLLDTLGYVRN